MSGWRCEGCRTTYPPGVSDCPPCAARKKVTAVAHGNALTGSTHYVAEGDPLPADLNEEVRLVGPGAPPQVPAEEPLTRAGLDELIDEKIRAAAAPDPQGPGYDALQVRALRDELRSRGLPVTGAKAELVARLAEHDAGQLA